MISGWVEYFTNELSNHLKYKEYFKLNEGNIKETNIGDLDDKLNCFCFIFELSIYLLSAFFKSEYDIKFDINDKDKIIERAFNSGLFKNKKVWKKFLIIFNDFNEDTISELNIYKDYIEFIYKYFYEFEILVKYMNNEILSIGNNLNVIK